MTIREASETWVSIARMSPENPELGPALGKLAKAICSMKANKGTLSKIVKPVDYVEQYTVISGLVEGKMLTKEWHELLEAYFWNVRKRRC